MTIEITDPQSSRGDHRTWVTPSEMLRRPHLMLTNTGRDDDIVLVRFGLSVQLLDDLLRLHLFTVLRLALDIRERILLLPRFDILEPGRALRVLNHGKESRQVRRDVAKNGDGRFDDLVDVFGLDLEVDDTAPTLSGCGASRWGEGVDFAGHTIIKASTESDDDIGLLHRYVGIRATVHTEHMQTLLVRLIIGSETLQSRRDGNVPLLSQLRQELWAQLRLKNTIAGVDDGPLGLIDEIRSLPYELDV